MGSVNRQKYCLIFDRKIGVWCFTIARFGFYFLWQLSVSRSAVVQEACHLVVGQ